MEKSLMTSSVNPFKFNVGQKTAKSVYLPSNDNPQEEKKNEYFEETIEQYRKEITFLKQYISRINTEIRKNLNMEIPSLEDGFNSFLKSTQDSSLDQRVFDEWTNRLISVEYINPLMNLYDVHIENLESELAYNKKVLKQYDGKISDLVNENKQLRQELEVRNNEFKQFLVLKTEAPIEHQIVLDREYVAKLEERNETLSRENEILALNYHKLQKEAIDVKFNTNEIIKNGNEKIEAYDRLYQMYQDATNACENLNQKAQICELKMYEMSDKFNEIEKENEELREKIINLKDDYLKLETENKFLKEKLESQNDK